jgi:hypothetical protein
MPCHGRYPLKSLLNGLEALHCHNDSFPWLLLVQITVNICFLV